MRLNRGSGLVAMNREIGEMTVQCDSIGCHRMFVERDTEQDVLQEASGGHSMKIDLLVP